MYTKLIEMRIGVVIWDIVKNFIDAKCPEIEELSQIEQERVYGSIVQGVSEIILDDVLERTHDMIDELQRDYHWGAYRLDDEDKKLSYEEMSRGY
jgi:hypothetical protein